jgi:putative ABC transport system permease protein
MLVSAVRMVVQLTLVGFVLKLLFAALSPWFTLLTVLVMIGAAGYEVFSRQDRRFAGWFMHGIGSGPMALATTLVTLLALTTHIRQDPWYDPRYIVPLVGIILGNVMSGVSLCLSGFLGAVTRDRPAIEARLALGTDRFTALGPFIRRSLRAALIPIFNQMAAAGLITLPGMMTGQILAGMPPAEAVKYQILILFLLAGGTGLAVLMTLYLSAVRITDPRHRLRLDHLAAGPGSR